METQICNQFFPLFSTASPDTLDWLNEIVTTAEYERDEIILASDQWGQAVHIIISGWVKLQYLASDRKIVQAIIGKGDFFGATAILDTPPIKTEVVALTKVELIRISAQRFIQAIFKDHQLQHRLLQLLAKKISFLQRQSQLRYQPAAVKLVNILIGLAENYGQPAESGTKIFYLSEIDLAALSDLDVDEISKIMDNLQSNGWLEIDERDRTLSLINLKQLTHLAGKI
jgi:CRP-like cAMP-binding protein